MPHSYYNITMFQCTNEEVPLNKNLAKIHEKYPSPWKLHKFNESELLQRLFYKALGYPLILSIIYKLFEKPFGISFSYRYIHLEVTCA